MTKPILKAKAGPKPMELDSVEVSNKWEELEDSYEHDDEEMGLCGQV